MKYDDIITQLLIFLASTTSTVYAIFSKNGDNYKFGKLGETISSVLGKKYLENSLSKVGLLIYYILYVIDVPSWKYNGHCIRWRMSEEEINQFKYANN